MTREDETVMVVCDTHDRPGVPGSWKVCSVCACEIFLSDSALKSADKNGFSRKNLQLHCLECARPKFCEITEYIPMTFEQVQEIRDVRERLSPKH